MIHLLKSDFEFILSKLTPKVIDRLRNKKIFITGGTGFFGRWILEFIHFANINTNLNCEVHVLTRDASKFFSKAPHLSSEKNFRFIIGNVTTFEYPPFKYDYIIHAATEANVKMNIECPLEMVDTVITGTKRVLDFAKETCSQKFLYISSGAVYGRQPPNIDFIQEDYLGAPLTIKADSAYGESKRIGEFLCSTYSRLYNINISIARCFAFIGPFLPLDAHFAAGNFINNGLAKQKIVIKGDGTTIRSYLYAGDLVIWLLTILVNGKNNEVYNVGSNETTNILGIAQRIASEFEPNPKIVVEKKPSPNVLPERYIPHVGKSLNELNLKINFDLNTAIAKTVAFYKSQEKLKEI